jgi:hypothetical protein
MIGSAGIGLADTKIGELITDRISHIVGKIADFADYERYEEK